MTSTEPSSAANAFDEDAALDVLLDVLPVAALPVLQYAQRRLRHVQAPDAGVQIRAISVLDGRWLCGLVEGNFDMSIK
jgi:hypothetical protein